MKIKNNTIYLLALGLILIGCQNPLTTVEEMNDKLDTMVTNTESMKNTTESMSNTTSAMANTTANMNGTTLLMKNETGELKQVSIDMSNNMRSKETEDTRTKSLLAMEAADTIARKVVHAAVYFQSFEYQLWKGTADDTKDTREVLLEKALNAFFRDIKEYIKKLDLNSISPSSKKNRVKNLYALSLTLHQKHYFTEVMEKRFAGFKVESIKDLIIDGLRARDNLAKKNQDTEVLSKAQKVVLENEENAVALLQMRMNVLTAMSLAKISDIEKKGTWKNLWSAGIVQKVFMLLKDWESQFGDLNIVQQETLVSYLKEAVSVKQTLIDLGYNPILDNKISKIFGNMKMINVSPNCNRCEITAMQFEELLIELLR